MIKRWYTFFLVGFFGISFQFARSQDTIVLNDEVIQGKSLADRFHVTIFERDVPIADFLYGVQDGEKIKMTRNVENFDFTSKTYFIEFYLLNPSESSKRIILETARPITNEVSLYIRGKGVLESGDRIPFDKRVIPVQESSFPVRLDAKELGHFVLRIKSDGESLTVPMRFWNNDEFYHHISDKGFAYGIYYGVFVFVILIYFIFYVQLGDTLFLTYCLYVFFSGLLQFALDGYMYRFIFPSGGYFADHSVIVVAGIAVFFALRYAAKYLNLIGNQKRLIVGIEVLVVTTIIFSLFNGPIMEVTYVLINVISLIAVLSLLFLSIRIKRKNTSISPLYLVGILALLTGAIVFILGNAGVLNAPDLTQYGLKAGALTEAIFLSILMAGKYRELQKEKEFAQQQLVVELEQKNKFISDSNIRLEQEVRERTKEIEMNRLELKERNDDLLASIKYAERLQQALLTDKRKFQFVFEESFIFFQPRDIVSGDFFWADEIRPNTFWPKGLKVFAVADCTGHGVPGAFVSIVCNNLLKMAATHSEVNYPGEALNLIDRELQTIFNSERTDAIKDGMDISLVAIDPDSNRLFFAGARNSILIVRNGDEIILEADKRSVGYSEDRTQEFATNELELLPNDMIYAFSDGFPDQFGGERGKKYLSKRLRGTLAMNSSMSCYEQGKLIEEEFLNWKGNADQIDDVLVVGVRFTI